LAHSSIKILLQNDFLAHSSIIVNVTRWHIDHANNRINK